MIDIVSPDFANPAVWISLLTLSFLEIVLGIDNLIFISIIAGKLPAEKQRSVRNVGLLLAMLFRIVLLLFIQTIINLKQPAFVIPALYDITTSEISVSFKDLILIGGGLFLIIKSTLEIHHKIRTAKHSATEQKSKATKGVVWMVLLQIVMVDAVFSIDSILTAIGLVDSVIIMIIAVMVSIFVMMVFAGPVTRLINRQPTLQMLALTFLLVIGVVLIANGLHQEVSKGIIYSCLAFSLTVEVLNIRLRRNIDKG